MEEKAFFVWACQGANDVVVVHLLDERIRDTYGPQSIYCQGDGHGEGNAYAGGHGCQINCFDLSDGCCIQARQPDSWELWVWDGKHIWGMEPIRSSTMRNNAFKDITENGDAVLFWGCDPETAPWGWGGPGIGRDIVRRAFDRVGEDRPVLAIFNYAMMNAVNRVTRREVSNADMPRQNPPI